MDDFIIDKKVVVTSIIIIGAFYILLNLLCYFTLFLNIIIGGM
jgi:hypothetical protein